MKKWQRDDVWQRSIRDRFMPPVYAQWTFERRYVFVNKSRWSMLVQKRQAVDTTLQIDKDTSEGWEEKFVRWPGYVYDRFFFEVDSCTLEGLHSDGWMRYIEADTLLYGFVQDGERAIDAYIIKHFAEKVKPWFWEMYAEREHDKALQMIYKEHTMTSDNRTRGLLVPITDVTQITEVDRFYITEGGNYSTTPLPSSQSLFNSLLKQKPLLKQAYQNAPTQDKVKLTDKEKTIIINFPTHHDNEVDDKFDPQGYNNDSLWG